MTMTMTHKLRLFQSTRPRGTRRRQVSQPSGARSFNPRVRAGRDKQDKTIIIHAPVSIHASARDATRRRLWSCTSVRCFNPRVRAGRDDFTPVILRYTSVSIHASARDAILSAQNNSLGLWFQSTRPRGTRPGCRSAKSGTGCFNPRVRAGRDNPRQAFD